MRKSITLYGLTFSLPMLIWQALFFLAPLLFLIALSFWTVKNFRMEPDFDTVNWVRMLGRGVFWDAYLRTFALATAAAVITSALAFPCAYAIAFKLTETARRWAIFLMVIPFFTSYLVRVYSWQIFLSDNGIINALFAKVGLGPFGMLNSVFGTMVGYLTLSFPLVVLLQLFSLIFVDKNLIEAAHNLRCGRLRTVFAVIVPAAKVGLVIAALFCFILTFGDFVSPLYLGGGDPPTLSILITDTTKSGQQWPRAAVIALTMIATLLAVAFAAVGYAYKERGR
ncbi:spermidine/putrescine transport system permease protein/putrescine transport system permease protein [Aminobacter ciceronei]|uniref:Spermidine/putrescine transport system permease protein/putrescine transport system permease protein n=2 Tax=Aminobacter ciceronei TaxID=150723 RepID=A0ABR6CI17_9HYPH|nr:MULTISPECIES: ABC transporter permease [Aminobacter]MBA8910918.1 spermidine/putrescine transport system permease protein/putrescine transport system permease protein [Aminobacter ciceronei]MBA9024698.1 spermidine/putrescine transport system permease protein/putrescine transport system permease protein [Aminobacter ciceronei]MRX37603.1 ABC transporter permease subunit [Aminobacter sp. MDW-2]QNH35541.1 ABC transporter permease [Aminobacter sp. MDW-2]QNH35556.1 ABC transporter permease [Aminob